jgi:hypothetical protein
MKPHPLVSQLRFARGNPGRIFFRAGFMSTSQFLHSAQMELSNRDSSDHV